MLVKRVGDHRVQPRAHQHDAVNAVDQRPHLVGHPVGDVAEAHLHARAGHLQRAHRLDALRHVLLAAADGQHQRVDDQVFQRHADLFAARMSFSSAMLTRASALMGMPSASIVSPISLVLYFLGDERHLLQPLGLGRCGVDDRLPLDDLHAASMAPRLVVSRQSGTSTTSCTASTSHGRISWPSFFCGPMFRSTAHAPASTCLTADSWKYLRSRLGNRLFDFGRQDVDVFADDSREMSPRLA